MNEPRCLAAARFYKKAKQFRLFGNHAAEICPPDDKIKTKIHFEEFLKRDVVGKENAAVSALNVYKRAVEDRYKGLWLPENHRQTFLPVLRRIRSYQKTNDDKPKKSKRGAIKTRDSATSPTDFLSIHVENAAQIASTSSFNESIGTVGTMLTQYDGENEMVCNKLLKFLEILNNITKFY